MQQADILKQGHKPVRLKLWQSLFQRLLSKAQAGTLHVRFSDGNYFTIRGADEGPQAVLHLHNLRPVWRLITAGELGFARSYLEGDWDSPDVGAVLGFALKNEQALLSLLRTSGVWGRLDYWRHRLRPNSVRGSRQNIAFHYDLGNDFYRLWLDESLTYSSALFTRPDLTLFEAQAAKYARILTQLNIGPEDHVLEVGCGWGGFAEYAVRKTGCRVTGLTLSTEQAHYARARLKAAGFEDRTDIRLEDYRHVTGTYDKIVSIEMFEAVGEDNWPVYFDVLRQRLKPEGRALIQTITISDERFEHYRRHADFIQTYIFPGGMLPSPDAFRRSATASGFKVDEALAFGSDYARTLRLWDQAFIKEWDSIKVQGFDQRFFRMWHYYLQYCAAGFEGDPLDVYQYTLSV
ncbi:SAM-dependent methyltransferase [Asticcacaulis tiandongensis]|uniref:SAM-dependent methyltransferase n=1 Tax=Asticcacaulis tiandongensis TaxID=2565365 RepID=UPI00112EAEEB|nr:cyclopropane-fatty-acyl-phospholipid synthase family protein [Asticcacaulis tiandongensis]